MASSSSSSSLPSVPAFSSQLWKYHVFLSFRGEDTRKTFVDHLYSSLEQQGIHTYKDDETLPRGESIGPSLMKAIEESQIVIIVFSKNYADSSWCLDELAYIMKCKDTRGQIVMPIFYDVSPSIVRKQKKKYGKAFAKHELENKNNVESWRKALVEASNLSGWEPRNIANGHESMVIKEIVDTISQRLCLLTSSENENLIGIEARTQDLKSKLDIGSGGVRMIGLWGVGGGGKTTLAFSVYNEICSKFDGCCFLENIREDSRRYGLERLQDKILSNVLKQKEIEVNGVGGGRWLINNRLRHRKVLIVLDDVDHLDQLKALAGSHYWFGEGSRIIIATRNENLLNAHKVNVIHNISLLNDDEAFKLFWKHALLDHQPMEDYEILSKDVVSYARGLPLALTTLGSFLCDKSINEWVSALARLKEIPDTDIVGKLKISFDGLTLIEKDLFLDIACFFRREDKDEAMKTLHACGLHPVIGVKVLIQKALITISNGMFDMHDLVQEMGHCIVRGEHPNNPEKHSRVWKKEDVLKICAMDATTDLHMIEAIKLKCSTADPLQRLPLIIANMKNLKRINWEGDMASPLPANFSPGKLCCLKMEGISQKQLWEGYKYLPNLKIMELYGLRNLIMTPNFDGLPNLERFKLTECWHIEEIHPSIGRLERLVFLAIEGCMRLKMFPRITRLKKLETLQFSGCPKLFDPLKIQQNLDNLQHLQLDNSEAKAASDMKSCTNFFVTWLAGCSNVHGYTVLKEEREGLIDVEENRLEEACLPYNINHTIGLRRGLKKLNLSFCNLADEVIRSAAVWDLPNLEDLDLTANKFSRLNFSRLQLSRLKRLNVSRCGELVELSKLPSSIAVVIADDCHQLETFGDISNCKWLWKLALRGGNKLSAITSDAIMNSMLEGNAIEHHFISVTHHDRVMLEKFLGSPYRRETFKLHLPSDWHIDFCGFLVRIATKIKYPNINIVIKQEPEESNKVQDYDFVKYGVEFEQILIGYVSFGSLMHTTSLNSSYNTISISLDSMYWSGSCVGAELVPRKRARYRVQTTDCSEFWEKEKTFVVEHNSKSSIEILWRSYECTS